MYKRYLELGDNPCPLTKYMAKVCVYLLNSVTNLSSIILLCTENKKSKQKFKFNEFKSWKSRNYDSRWSAKRRFLKYKILYFLESNDEVESLEGVVETEQVTQSIQLEENDMRDTDDDFFRSINDQLIHPNLQCKTADAIVMILAYFLKHNLTWVALEDLLEIFHNILG